MMDFAKAIFALPLLGCLAGCYPYTQTAYSPAVVERPQRVDFFCGELIAKRAASLEYGYDTGIGVTPFLHYPSAGIHFGGRGPDGGARISAGIVDVYVEARAPNLPATEYTVALDNGTDPRDPYLPNERKSAIIVVQNADPNNPEPSLSVPSRVVVRVVGRSARVMNDVTGASASVCQPYTYPGYSHPELQATQPMPVPLAGGCCEYADRKWELLRGPQEFGLYAYGSY